MFIRPPPSSDATSRLTTSFNSEVQQQLLFVGSHAEQGSSFAAPAVSLQFGRKDPWVHIVVTCT
eukprot:11671784-Prorocentrum_lima.AAC.1